MNAEEYEERLEGLIEMVVDLYGIIGKLFGLLPIPISLPALWDDDRDEGPDVATLIGALTRARAMLMDLPLDPRLTALLNLAVVEWLGAFDMCALADANRTSPEADAYRLEVIWLATGRITSLTELARDQLHLDL
ncbi:hypothetical protein [Nonomuraea turcica]|uniref:hypothetical protein n=1 Tax=Nonomuraea sp. G32 TaxID=3067274 RepID=UPI00273B36F9|nr:hypothetical protein [Nonomuraea sp. G32]MDP4510343.1 hypothetical protein [Nonomuraea sp. G32]